MRRRSDTNHLPQINPGQCGFRTKRISGAVMKIVLAAAALVAALVSPAQAARPDSDAELATLLKGRVAAAPVRCISISPNGTSPTIVSGRAIVWRDGARLYVNTLRARAEMLDDDDILITEPFGSQLCRNDQVRLLNRMSRIPKAPLILGEFTPYVRAGTK
jgi:hypothetical protein